MTAPYIAATDRSERAAAVSVGMAFFGAGSVKSAGLVDETMDVGTKTLLIGSLVGGIPVGIAAHLIAAKIKARERKERELQAKIDYYRNAGRSIEQGLTAEGVQP
jgi:hypothetical protein